MFFLFVGLSSARIVATAIRALFVVQQKLVASGAAGERGRILVVAATAQGKQLQRKLWGTFLFNFFTVLLRSIFTIMYALAQRSQDYGNTCAVSHCDPCKNVYVSSAFPTVIICNSLVRYSHILFWIIYTPMFQFLVILISCPMALLVALWGMTGVQSMESMQTQQIELKTASRSTSGNSRL